MEKLMKEHMPRYLNEINKTLEQRPDLKFISGNTVTIYDIYVAGYMHNYIVNPNVSFAEGWT